MSPDWWRDCRDGIEKCSSPTGDGNDQQGDTGLSDCIEKCSSPTGDGNNNDGKLFVDILELRNVVPRQGTETRRPFINRKTSKIIEKCSSPTGDGNGVFIFFKLRKRPLQLRNVVPRQGTETL